MSRITKASRGFTLVELAVTLTVLGLLLAFSIPAFNRINQTYQLKAATQNVAGTMRLWRERAMARGTECEVHYNTSFFGKNWHIHEYDSNSGVQIGLYPGGTFPPGITYYTVPTANPRFTRDGREKYGFSGTVILRNQRDMRDTVSVLASGLIIE